MKSDIKFWPHKEIKIADLNDYEHNPRLITKIAFERMINDIKRYGFHNRILVDVYGGGTRKQNTIIGGHQRKAALLAAGFEKNDIIQVLTSPRELTEEEFQELNVKDNLPYGTWNTEILANHFDNTKLPEWGFESPVWPEKEIEVLEGEDDEVSPDFNKQPISKYGDIWILGNHRLMCGDSTKVDEVERLMNGEKADLFFSDPPYGVSYADKNKALNAIAPANRIQTKIENDHLSLDGTSDLWLQAFLNAFVATSDKASYYICGPQGGELMMMMMMMIDKSGWELKHCMIWAKNNHVLGRADYHYKHEPILYGWKQGKSHNWYGDHSQTSLWEIDKPLKNELHPTMKPIELCGKAIKNNTTKHNSVLDLFGGSGSTLMACEQLERQCYMMELSPHYCDVIIQRWEKLTGKKAELEKPQ